MIDRDEIALAKSLPRGARNALLAMTDEFVLPGKATFNANGAFNLLWHARSYGGLAEYKTIDRRAAYRLTPLGARIRDRLLAAQGIDARKGQDGETRLDAKHESPVVAISDDAPNPSGESQQ